MKTEKGFVVTAVNGRQRPVIVCEECGEIISDCEMAGVVWQQSDYDEGSRLKVTVLCKTNHCLSSEPYKHLTHTEFKLYALWLLYNCGVKTEEQLLAAWKLAGPISTP